MTFDSIAFALFLPFVFVIYWQLTGNRQRQNVFLLIASYVFYGWWNWRLLGLIILTTATSYLCAKVVYKSNSTNNKGRACFFNIINIVINLGILGVFKYYDFFAQSFNTLMHLIGVNASWSLLHLILPMGISFYTFQALSYTIDVYRGNLKAEDNPINYATYLAFFPQLVAGPIERAGRLLPQFVSPSKFNYKEAVEGSRQMLWGFAKKIVIADNCAAIVELIFSDPQSAGGSALLYGTLLFSFQIYADFSGYSDIAIGTARLFGIRLSPNFNNPYFATSIPDFWRRWHMSLTSWFRDYVYIPLGGSRRGPYVTFLNTLFVFTLSGLWHGANWTFITWGFYSGLLFLPWCMGWLRKNKGEDERSFLQRLPSMVLTFFFVCIGWAIFRSENLSQAWMILSRIITHPDLSALQYSKSILLFVVLMLAAEWWHLKLPKHRWQRWAIYYMLIALMIWKATASTQFIYFQF